MRCVLLLSLAAAAAAQPTVTLQPEIRQAVAAVEAERLERTVRRLVAFGTRHTLSDTKSPTRGIGAARRWLREELERVGGGRLRVAFDVHTFPPGRLLPRETRVVNVVAVLPGRDPDRYVILSAHYDSRASRPEDRVSDAPGADDDASGVACVLECARVMARFDPRANVVFLLTAGEEQGLLGARAYARRAREAGWRIEAFVTNDIVGGVADALGRRDPMRVRLFSEGVPSGGGRIVGSRNDAPSRQLARYLKLRGEAYVPGFRVTLIFRPDRFLRGGDHLAFNAAGFPGVRLSEPYENYAYQHQDVRLEGGKRYGDLPENLDYAYLRRVTQVNVAGFLELALAPAAPRRVRLRLRLSPQAELSWAANGEEDLAGYAVLYRPTDAPTWTHRLPVPKERTGVTLTGLSQDDYAFAVQAVDREGRRSLPVYPAPTRG